MWISKKSLILCGAILTYSSCASCFFLNWGESNIDQTRGVPAYYYSQRLFAPPVPYSTRNNEPPSSLPVQIPAIPIQVPLQAAFSSLGNAHNVQLVPCLCPVSPETDVNKEQDGRSAFLNHIKNSRVQEE